MSFHISISFGLSQRFLQQVAVQKNEWLHLSNSQRFHSWSGYAFETTCHKHANEIIGALGIAGIAVKISHWLGIKKETEDTHRHAQIDLVLDRADRVVTLCEAKFTRTPFSITDKFIKRLHEKQTIFAEKTGTTRFINWALISAAGVSQREQANHHFTKVITAEDLFLL